MWDEEGLPADKLASHVESPVSPQTTGMKQGLGAKGDPNFDLKMPSPRPT